MKKEEKIKEDDYYLSSRFFRDNNKKLEEVEKLHERLKELLLLAAKEIVPEDVKRLYEKYPFIVKTTQSIRVSGRSRVESFLFSYDEDIISSGAYSVNLDIAEFEDKIPEILYKTICFYCNQILELKFSGLAEVRNEQATIKEMTYGEIELYYPEVYDLLYKENYCKTKEKIRELEEKIKETIN